MVKYFSRVRYLLLVPIILGAFINISVANTDCGKDFKCLKKAVEKCENNNIKFRLDHNIDHVDIKGEVEISTSKTGNNLCSLSINLNGIKANFDTETTRNYKSSKLSDKEIDILAAGYRKNKKIDKDSYKKCFFNVDKLNGLFSEVRDVIDIRLESSCAEEVTNVVAGPNFINDNSKANTANSATNDQVQKVKSVTTPAPEKPIQILPKSEKERKLIESVNAAIMGPKPSKVYEEKKKRGMTNDQIGQEAFDSFFSHLKKCGESDCEKMTCENCSKGTLFCSIQKRCIECYADKLGDCKSGFSCLMGICKKKMTVEEFMKLK